MRLHATTLILLPWLAFAADEQSKNIRLNIAPEPIVVDGAIDPAWATADSAVRFFQLLPNVGKPPTLSTVAKVLTTDESLYCLILCYAPVEEIEANAGVHDEFTGDVVSLMLDTFNDRQTAYKFGVSASGVCSDCRLVDDARNRDYTWDGVWYGTAQIHEWGFAVEIRVPYRSIRFNPALDRWGIDFDRWSAKRNEDQYWCTYEQNEGQRISRFGTLQFTGLRPSASGLNLEIYPVGYVRADAAPDRKTAVDPHLGLDVLYNPSEALTFQLTANPDFAQIEADPYDFNITRYESYFSERRPFFTEGSEAFRPAGKEQNTGFYAPLELFYSRRVGRILPDGSFVPLLVGTRAVGRLGEWEYGGFYALTGEKTYDDGGMTATESQASFLSARVKRRIMGNSSIGVLMVGKKSPDNLNGVLDVDGAFRATDWQLSYQLARSVNHGKGDFAGSAGFVAFGEHWSTLVRTLAVGNHFDVSEVGFVPWKGTAEVTALTGPTWFYDTGSLRRMQLFAGVSTQYEHADLYVDRSAVFVFNLNFRSNWGMEIDLLMGKSKDQGHLYNSYEIDLNSWFDISPRWHLNVNGGYSRTYNFPREYLANYTWWNIQGDWKVATLLELGATAASYIEFDPEGQIEEITYNARPYVSLTPVNDLNIRVYVDNVFLRSTGKMDRMFLGFLFSYNFLPKSWIYLAYNELRERNGEDQGPIPPIRSRVGVAKVRYLYFF